jgi:hypothetical protein
MPHAASADAGRRYPPPVVHLHDFQHIKRAGEAGFRLRAVGAGRGRQAAPAALGERERICEGVGVARAINATAGRSGGLGDGQK